MTAAFFSRNNLAASTDAWDRRILHQERVQPLHKYCTSPIAEVDLRGRQECTPLAHNRRGSRAAQAQEAHTGKYALARHRPSLSQARWAGVLPSGRPQDLVRPNAPSIIFWSEAVSWPALSGTLIAIILVVASAVSARTPLIVWNASPSVPTGLYRVLRMSPRPGDVALVRLPRRIASLAARRAYLSANAYLLKPVAAVSGAYVCRVGTRIFIRGALAGRARISDRRGRPMPIWSGCRTLQPGEALVLAEDPESFDGRYFGPLSHQYLIGRSLLIW